MTFSYADAMRGAKRPPTMTGESQGTAKNQTNEPARPSLLKADHATPHYQVARNNQIADNQQSIAAPQSKNVPSSSQQESKNPTATDAKWNTVSRNIKTGPGTKMFSPQGKTGYNDAPKHILRKGATVSPSNRPSGNVSKLLGSNSSTLSNKPTAATPQASSSDQIAAAIIVTESTNPRLTEASAPAKNGPKKSKKPKPQPRMLNLGDLISDQVGKKNSNSNQASEQLETAQKQQQEKQQLATITKKTKQPRAVASITPLNVHSSLDFPALAAHSQQYDNPTTNASPKKFAWAKESSSTPRTAAPKSPVSNTVKVLKRGEPVPDTAVPGSLRKNPPSQTNNNTIKKEHGKGSAPSPSKSKVSLAHPSLEKVAAPSAKLTAASFFAPIAANRDTQTGDEHQLFRMLQDRKVYQKKGRQRLAPRRKKFTALKKKVLQERLAKWRALHPEEVATPAVTTHLTSNTSVSSPVASFAMGKTNETVSCCVCIYGFTRHDELGDDDEYEEIVENLRDMGVKVGPVEEVIVPRELDVTNLPVFVKFQSPRDAAAAKSCWNGLSIGGQHLEVLLVNDNISNDTTSWSDAVLAAERRDAIPSSEASRNSQEESPKVTTIVIQDVLTDDDYEDEDCMNESLRDIAELAQKLGKIIAMKAGSEKNGSIEIVYDCGKDDAWSIVDKLCQISLGGKPLTAVVLAESNFSSQSSTSKGTTIMLQNVLTDDDYDDEDCMKESLRDVEELARQFGRIIELKPSSEKNGSIKIHYDCGMDDAESIVDKLSQINLGGKPLSAISLAGQEGSSASPSPDSGIVVLENALTKEDLDDPDCLEESLNDLRRHVETHGLVSSVKAVGSSVHVAFTHGIDVARKAMDAMNGTILGGTPITAYILLQELAEDEGVCVYLRNILTDDDLADEECLEESLNDLRELAVKYGEVLSLDVIRDGEDGILKVVYGGNDVENAVENFNGMVIGGHVVSATIDPPRSTEDIKVESSGQSQSKGEFNQSDLTASDCAGEKRLPLDGSGSSTSKKPRTDDVTPLYSGDKLVPERFAECKRVPKVANASGPREYAKIINDESVKPLLTEMLGELMRLQKRAVDDKNAKARRRIVMGLREVARGIRAHKVKMVIMANNLDEYGAIDEKLQEIIDLARSEEVPLFFEFTKRSLGKAVGKSIKVAVVGVQNADGAYEPFKKLRNIAEKM